MQHHEGNPGVDSGTHLSIEYTSITAHIYSSSRLAIFSVLSVLSLGILPIICNNKIQLWTFIARAPAGYFRDADYVLVKSKDGSFEEIEVQKIKGRMLLSVSGGEKVGPTGVYESWNAASDMEKGAEADSGKIVQRENPDDRERVFKYFDYKKQRYVFREGTGSFLVGVLHIDLKCENTKNK